MNNILGLDINTISTGFSVIDEEEKLLKYGVIDTSEQEDMYSKLDAFSLLIQPLSEEFCFEKIGVEDALGKFLAGKSNIKTIAALLRFNALASYKCYEIFEVKPRHLNVLRARSLALGHSIPRGLQSKIYVLEQVMKWYPDIELPKMKRKDDYAKTAFDICDSIIISKAILRDDRE